MDGIEKSKTESRNTPDFSSEISDTVPHINGEYSTDSIINEFEFNDESVSRYESAIKWYRWLKGKPFILIGIAYLSAVISRAILETQTSVSEQTTNDVMLLFFGIFGLAASIGWVLKKIARNRANNENLSKQDAIYHNIVKSFESYKDDRLDDTRKYLKSTNELLGKESGRAFDPEFTQELATYLDEVEERDSEKFLLESFPIIANRILQYLSSVKQADLEGVYNEGEDENSPANQYTPKNMVTSYLGDWTNKRVVRITAPFVLVSPIIWIIYTNMSKTGAQIFFLAFIAVVQIYYNLRED
jgi:hypothetical protein